MIIHVNKNIISRCNDIKNLGSSQSIVFFQKISIFYSVYKTQLEKNTNNCVSGHLWKPNYREIFGHYYY